MDQCAKNCPSGYLKDLFGCDICECSDQCPPFSCGLICSADVGFAKSNDGCPICQCATTKSKPTEYTTSCQVCLNETVDFHFLFFFFIRMMSIVLRASDASMMLAMCRCVKQVYCDVLFLCRIFD